MIISKKQKASNILIYKKVIVKRCGKQGGTFAMMTEDGLVLFVAAPRITKDEKADFMYRTKHMGYITDNQGMICLVADNMLAVEICFYPHSEYEDQIKKGCCNFLTVVLIDNIKDTVEDIKILRIPKEIKHKLQEQWLLSIEKGLSFADYNMWMFLTNYTQHWSESISKAEAFQKAEEVPAPKSVCLNFDYIFEE